MTKTVSCCPESPMLGKRSGELTGYCEGHQYLTTKEGEPAAKLSRIIITINIPDKQVSTNISEMIGEIPDNNDKDVHVGCKKPENVPVFYKRTAGLMALVKPCGIIISCQELLSCESSSQLFVQLLQLACDTKTNFKYLGYDRACEFYPFLVNLSKKGNVGAKLLLEKKYVVDRFHIKGHTTPSCTLDSDQCKFHPDLPKFQELEHCNTECAEQCFSWFGKYRNTLNYMTQYKYKFFVYVLIKARNRLIEKKLLRHGKMV